MTPLPPQYDKPKYSIDLPAYDCTVCRNGIVWRKMEDMVNPDGTISFPFRRNWHRVYVSVTGTMLQVFSLNTKQKVRETKLSGSHHTPDLAKLSRVVSSQSISSTSFRSALSKMSSGSSFGGGRPSEIDEPVEEYSLHNCLAGVALDYTKRVNVVRIRAGRDQFLFQCNGSRDAIEWLEIIQKGVNVADPLESREEPRFTSGRRRMKVNNLPYDIFEAAGDKAPLRKRHGIYPASFSIHRHCPGFRNESRPESRPPVTTEVKVLQSPQKKERFVCAVLVSTYPRDALQAQ